MTENAEIQYGACEIIQFIIQNCKDDILYFLIYTHDLFKEIINVDKVKEANMRLEN